MFEKLFSGLNKIFGVFGLNMQKVSIGESKHIDMVSGPEKPEEDIFEIHSIWDHLNFQENSQAYHVSKVINFDEWVTMDEIRRRIFELFGIEYKNSKSLYAYIKTMVDCGLLEVTDIGGKRKWRKKDLIIKIKRKNAEKEEKKAVQAIVS